ncbi:MAG: endo-1,3-alpha-glucanase family glycosylhydrolase [Gammaproteobacteria bacterium]
MTGQGTRGPRQSKADWTRDINDAISMGIDGWQLNFGHYRGRMKSNVETFIDALDELSDPASTFWFFPSFDCNDGRVPVYDEVEEWFAEYYFHPRHFRVNGLPLLTVWQGRSVGNDYFLELKEKLRRAGRPIAFIPWLATRANKQQMAWLFRQWSSMDGFAPWVPGLRVEDAIRMNFIAAELCDRHGLELIAGQGFNMLQINKAPRYVNKNAAEAVSKQMEPFVHGHLPNCRYLCVATWNDFGEDHHITPYPPWGPIGGKHPVWSHVGYATVVKYYLDWWKAGRQPSLDEDLVIIFHMTQLANEGKPPFPLESYGPDMAEDIVYLTTILREPGQVYVGSGGLPRVVFDAPSGISHWRAPAAPGLQVYGLERGGVTVIEQTSDRAIQSPPLEPWSWSHYSEVASAS